MITDIKKASRKTQRTIRYEFELENAALLNCVFAAISTREFRGFMEAFVFEDPRYAQLPRYRQECVNAYVRGALDALAHQEGLPASQPPDVVRPKRVSSNPPPPPPSPTFLESSFSHVWEATQDMRAAARQVRKRSIDHG